MKKTPPSYISTEMLLFPMFSYNKKFNNTNLITKNRMTVYPETSQRKCGAMILYKLVDPEWITVNCDEPLVSGAFCVISRGNTSNASAFNPTSDLIINDRKCVMRNNTCFLFLWVKVSFIEITKNTEYIYLPHFSSVKYFQFLFEAISIQFPPVFIEDAKWTVTYEKFANVFNYERDLVHNRSIEAYGIYIQRPTIQLIGTNLFQCNSSLYISIYFVCDGKADCPGEHPTDEMGCHCNYTQILSSRCKFILNHKRKQTCSVFYLQTKDNKCQMLSSNHTVLENTKISENECPITNAKFSHLENHFRPFLLNGSKSRCFTEAYNNFDQSSNLYTCKSGKQISVHLLNDLVSDCGSHAEDEFLLKYMVTGTKFACPIKGQLPCVEGHGKCYDVSQICTYKLNLFNHLLPCRTGQHLENCKTFECNAMYKCPDYYCIQWSYVCDGKWDCPYGNEENLNYCNSTTMCAHMFKCRNSHICIHYFDICNNETDCPYGDDEMMCLLKDTNCIKYCHCLGFTISCVNVIKFDDAFIRNFNFVSVHIRHSSKYFVKMICDSAKTISILRLNLNNLTTVCNLLPPLRKGFIVDLSFNVIKVITDVCFENAPYLTEIILSHNKLKTIHRKAFFNLPALAILNLSQNKLKHLFMSQLLYSSNLVLLNLQNNNSQDFSSYLLPHDKQFLPTYYLCCQISRPTICITRKPWYLSCNNFFLNSQVKISVYSAIIFILIPNLLCISSQSFLLNPDSFGFHQIIIAINLIDINYAVYLMLLIIGNQHFIHEFMWTSSPFCFVIFALLLNFSITSILFNCLATLCRLMIIKYPVKTKFKQPRYLLKLIVCSFTLSCVFTFVISVIMKLFSLPITTPFCIPFVDPSNSILLVKFLMWFITVCQFLATGVTATWYISLFYELKKATEKVQNPSSKKVSYVSILIQIAVLFSANTLTWIPSGSIYFVIMMMEKYPMEIVLWTIIVIGPISAIVTPSVFIRSTMIKMMKIQDVRLTIKQLRVSIKH